MTEPLNQRNTLIRYLLGVASERERDAVEEQYFANKAGLDELLRAEDELIDDYVTGVLSDSDQRLFERHFLGTKYRRQRLEEIKTLVEVLAATDNAELPVASEEGQLPQSKTATEVNSDTDQAITPEAPAGSDLGVDRFARLLGWLDPDLDKAAEKYERIRSGLIKIFESRGVSNAEELADNAIDRVTLRVSQLAKTYIGDPTMYFYGVGRQLLREAQQRSQAEIVREAIVWSAGEPNQTAECLGKCLQRLSENDRELILQYYGYEKGSRSQNRAKMAEGLGISLNALRIRAQNLRRFLNNCVKSCLQHQGEVKADDSPSDSFSARPHSEE